MPTPRPRERKHVLFAVSLAVFAGVLVAVQAALLGPFGRHVHPLVGALWVHIAGSVLAAAIVLVAGLGLGWSGVRAFPWGLSAGFAGVGIVAAIAGAVTRLGLGTTIVVVTATQLALGLALDAFGVTGRTIPLSLMRLAGVALVVAGAALMFVRQR